MTPPEHEFSSLPPRVLAAYPTRYFLETGTNTGKGVDIALAHRPPYDMIWSCERDATLWRANWARFTDASPVRLVHGDSPELLRKVLLGLDQPAFIYLDAHTEDSNPLLAELDAIAEVVAANPGHGHVVAVDDVRMFGNLSMPGWTPIHWNAVIDRLRRIQPTYTYRRWDTCNGLGDLLVAATTHPEILR